MRLSSKVWALVGVAAFSAGCTQVPLRVDTQPNIAKILSPEFDNYVDRLMGLWGIKGIALSLVKPDGEVEYGAWGNRSEDGSAMTPDTLFGIASCSKAFLSAAMGIIMDDYAHGRNSTPLPSGLTTFNWETKVKDLLPGEWKLQDEWATEKANVLDILSHVSGLPRHDGSYGPDDSPADLVRRMRYLKPAHELRQKFSYNNQMYVTAAYIIEKLAGSYIDFVQVRIFGPLLMNSSTYHSDIAKRSGRLTQTWTSHGQRIPFWFPEETRTFNAGPGGVITNVVDLSRWIKMLLNSGVNPDSNATLVPNSAFIKATTSNVIMAGRGPSPELSVQGYGMGWGRTSYQGHELVTHSGGIPGFATQVTFYPNDNFGVAVLINSDGKNAVASALTHRISEDLLNLKRISHAEDPSASYPKPPSRPENATTSLPLPAYAGTYGNPGYGSFTLCDPAGSSLYCKKVLADFKTVDDAQNDPVPPHKDVPQLLGDWSRMWSSHIRLVHFENNSFDIALTALFPNGYGASSKPFETFEDDQYVGKAEFVVEDGKIVGIGTYVSDPDVTGKHEEGISVQDGSMVWFKKV